MYGDPKLDRLNKVSSDLWFVWYSAFKDKDPSAKELRQKWSKSVDELSDALKEWCDNNQESSTSSFAKKH